MTDHQVVKRWDPGQPLRDLSPARWIQERLWPWGSGSGRDGVPVGSIVPEGFEAYARLLHPAGRQIDRGWEPVRWATVASWTGRTAHPLMQFHRIANVPWPEPPSWGSLPSVGSLPVREAELLVDCLRGFTSSPAHSYLAMWEGFGVRELNALAPYPRLEVPHRAYYVFTGPLDAIPWLAFGDFRQSPNLWWPEDRAWLVATEIDLYDTYVGGSRACIARIVADPAFEAFETTPDARVDIGGDVINA